MSNVPVEGIVVAIFSIWFLLSVGFQIAPISAKIGRFDRFGFLPRWTFFAPNPGTYDHHLVYRECGADVDVSSIEKLDSVGPLLSPWQQVERLNGGVCIPFIWNPHRRVTKTVTDIVNTLVVARTHLNNPDFIQFTVEYFMLLHLIARDAPASVQRQFAIVRTHGFLGDRTPELVFISNFHRMGVMQ
jgi:hypothetical protein